MFDPQNITRRQQTFVLEPAGGGSRPSRTPAGSPATSSRRSAATADHGDFWDRDADDLLTGLLLAAAVDGAALHRGLRLAQLDPVRRPPSTPRARRLHRSSPTSMAVAPRARAETREGVYATARAAAACLADPAHHGLGHPASLRLDDLRPRGRSSASRQTLYLLSKDGAGSAAPLVAAFADRVMLEAVRAAEHRRAAGSTRRWSPSSTKPRTSAGSPNSRGCTPTSAPAASPR